MRRIIVSTCSLLLVLAGCGSIDNAGEVAPVLTVTAAPVTVVVQADPQKEIVMTNTVSTTPEEEQPTTRPTTPPVSTTTPMSTTTPAPATPTVPSTPTLPLRRATKMPVQAAPSKSPAPTGTQIELPRDPQLQAVVEGVRADLAQRQGVAIDAVEVVEVRSVIWPNSALGCPQPGMGYKQVTVDGLLIRLRIGGQIFNYHSGGSKPPFLCQQKLVPTVGSGGESQ